MVDLQAVEITNLTVDKYGWVKGVKNEIQLAEIPPRRSVRRYEPGVVHRCAYGCWRRAPVAEITATTAIDLDLFWGFDVNGDGVPQEEELYDYSATATSFEYLTEWGFDAGEYPDV